MWLFHKHVERRTHRGCRDCGESDIGVWGQLQTGRCCPVFPQGPSVDKPWRPTATCCARQCPRKKPDSGFFGCHCTAVLQQTLGIPVLTPSQSWGLPPQCARAMDQIEGAAILAYHKRVTRGAWHSAHPAEIEMTVIFLVLSCSISLLLVSDSIRLWLQDSGASLEHTWSQNLLKVSVFSLETWLFITGGGAVGEAAEAKSGPEK